VAGLAVLARVAGLLDVSPIPLYLLAGLALGEGGLVPIGFSEQFVAGGADIGVVLLLFMLGLEYSGEELKASLRSNLDAGLIDLALNFTPGLAAGFLLGWDPLAAVLLGGVTWISSSGVIAKVLADLGRIGNRETPVVLSLLVLEDLAMAAYLPLVAVLLLGTGLVESVLALVAALGAAGVALLLALRYGHLMSRALEHRSNEVVLLSVLGLILVVAGVAQELQVSAAIGAFLVGIALSGDVADHARSLFGSLRDLFAAVFFVFFALQIDPGEIPDVAVAALLLGLATGATKFVTGVVAARRAGIGPRGAARAGAALISRGEFSILIAGLGVGAGVEAGLGPLAAAYVLLMAIAGSVLARVADPIAETFLRRRAARQAVRGSPA
jgi:CPA2 family monovalent cation:H+ antiporter-2